MNLKKILVLYKAGQSGHTIARKLNIPVSTVYYLIRGAGVKRRTRSESMSIWWSRHKYKPKKME